MLQMAFVLLACLSFGPISVVAQQGKASISFGFPIDVQSCESSHLLQVQRALHDVQVLTALSLDTLLRTPNAEVVRRYFGLASDEIDVTVPIGVLTRIKDAKKDVNVLIRCEGPTSMACKQSERIVDEGGYVARIANKTSAVSICATDFSDSEGLHRKFLEDICQDDWTLSDNTPTTYWPAAMLSLLLQTSQLSSPSMRPVVRTYSNVLALARRDPRQAEHNIYTYLYFTLDLFARAHVRGGCPGQVSGRINEIPWRS